MPQAPQSFSYATPEETSLEQSALQGYTPSPRQRRASGPPFTPPLSPSSGGGPLCQSMADSARVSPEHPLAITGCRDCQNVPLPAESSSTAVPKTPKQSSLKFCNRLTDGTQLKDQLLLVYHRSLRKLHRDIHLQVFSQYSAAIVATSCGPMIFTPAQEHQGSLPQGLPTAQLDPSPSG